MSLVCLSFKSHHWTVSGDGYGNAFTSRIWGWGCSLTAINIIEVIYFAGLSIAQNPYHKFDCLCQINKFHLIYSDIFS